jgi:putative lysine transport system substrate-binding protein
MRKKLSLLMAVCLTTVILLTGCGASNTKETGTFKVGLEAGYAPFNWTQMGDANGGVIIDGARNMQADTMWKSPRKLQKVWGKN